MILYPAVDMLNGKAVRLKKGLRHEVTEYGHPAELAEKWRSLGGEWLHLVDLDAAFDGTSVALPLIREVVKAFNGPVELGGGIRTMDDITARFDCGVSRCILGTAAVEHPELVEEACRRFPGQIAVGIDAKNGMVATRGWVESSGITAVDLALKMKALGVTTVIYTDVSRDGMLQGPNVPATQLLVEQSGLDITGSGGVSCYDDLIQLKQAGCAGAILGKALYENAITLPEALARVR